jgi:hypothetical protein
MAKKATAETTEVATQEIENFNKQPKVVEPKKPKKPEWEIKDRTYFLKGSHTPLTHTIPSRHSSRYPLIWFDKNDGTQKELRYATNQNSPFVENQKGQVTLGHIVFKNGTLTVPKEKQNLQKLLSLYHPYINVKYSEFDSVKKAVDELDYLNLEFDAMSAAKTMDIDQAEAILRVELGSKVTTMSSKELKRDLLLFARNNPAAFINLANDENVMLRNFAIRASEAGIINLSGDQRTFTWGSNGRKLMNVPFDENPFSAFAAFLKTDEGVEIYKSIDKKL